MPKKYTTRKRKQSGGESNAYTFGAAVAPGAPYASQVIPVSACQAVSRPGEIMGYSPPGRGGLPGFAGGGRRYKKWTLKQLKRLHKKKMRGGRYAVGAPLGEAATGQLTGPNVFLANQKLGCNYYGGSRRRKSQRGGASLLGGPDLAAYAAPTAGYTNNASTWVSSTGSPVLLQQPYDARTMNPACLKTGGGKKRRATKRRATKKAWSWW